MINHIAKLLYKIFKVYDIPITYNTIEQTINTHPEFPFMQSISDALDGWKIKHVVMKLTIEKLYALDIPVIAQLKKGKYVWVTQVTETDVIFWNDSNKRIIENRDRFETEWSNVALAIEDITDAGEQGYNHKRFSEIKNKIFRYGITSGCIVLSFMLLFMSWLSDSILSFFHKILLLFANATGCFISYILIRQEKNQANSLMRKFCTAGTHIDCNSVTKSKYSKFFGMLSWAEVGMAYFIAVTIWVIIAPMSANWVSSLWWLLLIPLPFTVWSLFVQAFLIRKWCLFCCATILLLWINACILCFYIPFNITLYFFESALLALLLLVCIATVVYISNTYKSGDQFYTERVLNKFKYNYQVMKSQIAESGYTINNIGFTWGNPQSSQEIMLYVSIACSHCGAAIKELRKVSDIYPNFKYRLIFSVKTDDLDNKSNIITCHFLSLYRIMDNGAFFDMLDAWYAKLNKNFDALQKAFPTLSCQDNSEEINALYRFSQQLKISYSPAILINGRLLSKLYSYQDLYGMTRTLFAESSSG